MTLAAASMLPTPFLAKNVWALEAGMPLPIPPVLELDGSSGNMLDAIAGKHNFSLGRKTPTLGFSQGYLGPVLRMKRGKTSKLTIGNKTNDLITAHWHGMHVPGIVDGGPQLAFAPGRTWSPELEIDQPASTLWYHSHVHGRTAEQVYAGLAGMIYVDDPDGQKPSNARSHAPSR